jgi:hypothetical protein
MATPVPRRVSLATMICRCEPVPGPRAERLWGRGVRHAELTQASAAAAKERAPSEMHDRPRLTVGSFLGPYRGVSFSVLRRGYIFRAMNGFLSDGPAAGQVVEAGDPPVRRGVVVLGNEGSHGSAQLGDGPHRLVRDRRVVHRIARGRHRVSGTRPVGAARGCPGSRRNLSGGPPVPSAPVGSVRDD